jgi:hypothetical protein
MKYRKLRIAWSVWCCIACLLLIALWVRSYWVVDFIQGTWSGTKLVRIYIEPGTIGVGVTNQSFRLPWTNSPMPASKYMEAVRLRPNPPSRVWGYSAFTTTAWCLPFWHLILFVASVATLPWLRWRFSLRTLLIGMTMVAAALGLIIALSR